MSAGVSRANVETVLQLAPLSVERIVWICASLAVLSYTQNARRMLSSGSRHIAG